MRLKRLVVVAAGVFAVIVLIMAVSVAALTLRRRNLQDNVTRLEVAGERTARLGQAFTDQETAQRGFVIAGRDDFLVPYTDGVETADSLLAELSSSLPSPALRTLVDGVNTAAATWRAEGAEPSIAARRNGSPEDAAAVVEQSKPLFDALRARVDTLDGAIAVAVSSARSAELAAQVTLLTVLGAVLVVLLVVGIAGYVLARRLLVNPLQRMAASAEQIAAGDATAGITVSGPTEIASIARSVEHMRTQLQAQVLAAVAAREALGQQAVLVLKLQSELAGPLGEFPAGWDGGAGLLPAEGLVAGD